MAYSTDILKHLVIIQNRRKAAISKWGKDGEGVEWVSSEPIPASVDFARGKRAMNAGSLDVYGVVEVRMRWNDFTNMRSRMVYNGQVYNILGETFHEDYQDNIIQFHAQVIINDNQPLPSSSDLGSGRQTGDI